MKKLVLVKNHYPRFSKIAFFILFAILSVSFAKAQECSKKISFEMKSSSNYLLDKSNIERLDTMEILGLQQSESQSTVSICKGREGKFSIEIESPATKKSSGGKTFISDDRVNIADLEGNTLASVNYSELSGEDREAYQQLFSLKDFWIEKNQFSPEFMQQKLKEEGFSEEYNEKEKAKYVKENSYIHIDFAQKILTCSSFGDDGLATTATTRYKDFEEYLLPYEMIVKEKILSPRTQVCLTQLSITNFSNFNIQ